MDQTVTANLYHSGFNPLWDGVRWSGDKFSWDVDNDGDGVPDSVWVDLGMPVRSTADGRLYKPLFAILCVDLDGRLNLNAHGSIAQTDADVQRAPCRPPRWQAQFAGGGTPSCRGQGFGPAEINLGANVSASTTSPMNLYRDRDGRRRLSGAVRPKRRAPQWKR